MRGLFNSAMTNAAYVFFIISLITFILALASALRMGSDPSGGGVFLALTIAVQGAAIPFFVAVLLDRVDRWLETKK